MRFELLCLIALALIMITGCTGQIQTPEAVDIPIETHCKAPDVVEPKWETGGLSAPVGVFTGVQACYDDLPLHYGYETQLRAAVTACQ